MKRFVMLFAALSLLVSPVLAADNPCPCDTAKKVVKHVSKPRPRVVVYKATHDTVYIERGVAPQVVVQAAAPAPPCPEPAPLPEVVKVDLVKHPCGKAPCCGPRLSVMGGSLLNVDDGLFLGGVGANIPYSNAVVRPAVMAGSELVRVSLDVIHYWTPKGYFGVRPYLGMGLVGDWDRSGNTYSAVEPEAAGGDVALARGTEPACDDHNHCPTCPPGPKGDPGPPGPQGPKGDPGVSFVKDSNFDIQPSLVAGVQMRGCFAPFIEGRYVAGNNEDRRWYLGAGIGF